MNYSCDLIKRFGFWNDPFSTYLIWMFENEFWWKSLHFHEIKAYLVMTCAIHGHETGWPCTTTTYIHPLHAKWIKNIIKREIRVFFAYLIWAFMLKYPYMNQISFLYVSLHGFSREGCWMYFIFGKIYRGSSTCWPISV